MKVDVYNAIVSVIAEHKGLSHDLFNLLKERFTHVDHNTLFSIMSVEYQHKMKVNYIRSSSYINKYYSMYKEGVEGQEPPGIILRIAQEAEVAPCLVAKLILQKYFSQFTSCSSNKQVLQFNQYLRDTTLIEDRDLAYEVFLCTIYDDLYSPIVDALKHSLGQMYEIRLNRSLNELGLAFRDEEQLRKFGYDKTPDVKLEIPVAIDGFIIHWIESKAVFGSEEVHSDYVKNQYSSYWNRFGPGLVIYFFGYLENIVESSNKRFIIRDHMPTNILHIIQPEMDKATTKNSVNEKK